MVRCSMPLGFASGRGCRLGRFRVPRFRLPRPAAWGAEAGEEGDADAEADAPSPCACAPFCGTLEDRRPRRRLRLRPLAEVGLSDMDAFVTSEERREQSVSNVFNMLKLVLPAAGKALGIGQEGLSLPNGR